MGVYNNNYGNLFVTATPIGNMEDITLRAVKILSFVDCVVAENIRSAGFLLSYHSIKNRIISMNEYNEEFRILELINKIKIGENIALISNAGTPLISDPGFKFVREAIRSMIKIVPIPGVSAVITSLSVAGIPTDSFIFLGFPARKKGKRFDQLKEVCFERRTLVFYESPKRIKTFLSEVIDVLGDRYVVLSREMTKIYEEFIRGDASSVLAKLEKNDVSSRGEFTLLISGKFSRDSKDIKKDAVNSIKEYLNNYNICTLDLSRLISNQYRLSKKEAYSMVIKIKASLNI